MFRLADLILNVVEIPDSELHIMKMSIVMKYF
jgi:hypothetical protein